jgi:hypothetical protein
MTTYGVGGGDEQPAAAAAVTACGASPGHRFKHLMRRGPILVTYAGHDRAASPKLVPLSMTKCIGGVGE